MSKGKEPEPWYESKEHVSDQRFSCMFARVNLLSCQAARLLLKDERIREEAVEGGLETLEKASLLTFIWRWSKGKLHA